MPSLRGSSRFRKQRQVFHPGLFYFSLKSILVAFMIVKCPVYMTQLVFSWSDPPRLHTGGLASVYHHDCVMRRHLAKLPRSNTRALAFTFKRAKGTLRTLFVSKKTREGPVAMCAKDYTVLKL